MKGVQNAADFCRFRKKSLKAQVPRIHLEPTRRPMNFRGPLVKPTFLQLSYTSVALATIADPAPVSDRHHGQIAQYLDITNNP